MADLYSDYMRARRLPAAGGAGSMIIGLVSMLILYSLEHKGEHGAGAYEKLAAKLASWETVTGSGNPYVPATDRLPLFQLPSPRRIGGRPSLLIPRLAARRALGAAGVPFRAYKGFLCVQRSEMSACREALSAAGVEVPRLLAAAPVTVDATDYGLPAAVLAEKLRHLGFDAAAREEGPLVAVAFAPAQAATDLDEALMAIMARTDAASAPGKHATQTKGKDRGPRVLRDAPATDRQRDLAEALAAGLEAKGAYDEAAALRASASSCSTVGELSDLLHSAGARRSDSLDERLRRNPSITQRAPRRPAHMAAAPNEPTQAEECR